MQKIYAGNVEITLSNFIKWETKLKGIEHISGYLSINAQAKLDAPALKSVGGYLYINANIDINLEKQLWKSNSKNKWYVTDVCSEWLLSREGKITYRINNVDFDKPLFDQVRKGALSAHEVFSLSNTEQRRVAYERMDKIKMKELPDFKIIDETTDDGYGYAMRLVSFTMQGFDSPFYYLNCFCPSTGREYYLETREQTCEAAKSKSFGFDNIKFDIET